MSSVTPIPSKHTSKYAAPSRDLLSRIFLEADSVKHFSSGLLLPREPNRSKKEAPKSFCCYCCQGEIGKMPRQTHASAWLFSGSRNVGIVLEPLSLLGRSKPPICCSYGIAPLGLISRIPWNIRTIQSWSYILCLPFQILEYIKENHTSNATNKTM